MTVSERALDVLTNLRPQPYGTARAGSIVEPIIEPKWAGVRVLVGVESDRAAVLDQDGASVDERPEIRAALVNSVRAESVIVDGYLTKQAVRTGPDLLPTDEMPSMGVLIGQSLIGTRRNRTKEAAEELEREREAATFRDEDEVAFVAIDLLWLDGEPLLDVPLLERKRQLDTVLEESDLVRIGAFVRPPETTWVASWRRLGFVELSYRAANSRYHPGERRPEWATARMPRR